MVVYGLAVGPPFLIEAESEDEIVYEVGEYFVKRKPHQNSNNQVPYFVDNTDGKNICQSLHLHKHLMTEQMWKS